MLEFITGETKIKAMIMSFFDLLCPLDVRGFTRKKMNVIFQKYFNKEMVVYDIGCGKKPFISIIEPCVKQYIGVDLENGFFDKKYVDVVGTAYAVPVDSAQADVVLSTQVFEHLERPVDGLKETNRILKDKGLFILSFPLLYPIHAQPRDFYRYTKFGMEYLLKENGFEIIEKHEIGGFWLFTGFLMNRYINAFNRGVLKKLGIIYVFSWIQRFVFQILHSLEGIIFKLLKKDILNFRASWVLNYIYVAQKNKDKK